MCNRFIIYSRYEKYKYGGHVVYVCLAKNMASQRFLRWSFWPTTSMWNAFNTLRPGQNGRHFPDDIFKCLFLNENASVSIEISLKFGPKGPINNISALVQIMDWHRLSDKPLSELMMVSLLTLICVTRLQWVRINAHWAILHRYQHLPF